MRKTANSTPLGSWSACAGSPAIENPNLHDIANMNYRVELWDRYALHVRWVIAAVRHVSIARAAFDEAIRQFPERLTLRNGVLVLQEHDPATGKAG